MRRANEEDLDGIEPLLIALRRRDAIRERKPGIFYRGSTAFLHFHEHGGAIYADLKVGDKFERLALLDIGQTGLLELVDGVLERRCAFE